MGKTAERQGPQHWDLQSPVLGHWEPECLRLAALARSEEQRSRGRSGWRWWMRKVRTDVTDAQEALVMIPGGVREQVVRNTQGLSDFVA